MHRDRCSAQHEVRKWGWSVIASLHQFRNCRVPLVRSSVRTERLRVEGRCRRKRPLLCQRCEIQSLFGSPPNHANRHETLGDGERTIFANHKSVQPHKGTGAPTRKRGTRCKSKKKKRKPESLRIKKLPSATWVKQPKLFQSREVTKQRREVKKINFIFGFNRSETSSFRIIHKINIFSFPPSAS